MRNIFLLLFVLLSHLSFSQTSIRGQVRDTLENKPLRNAVVALVGASDSVLHGFTRSAPDGSFLLQAPGIGRYSLLVSFPKFADFAEQYTLEDGQQTDAGRISLTLKSKLLSEVVVRSAGAIRIKGDTTEFVADSFKVREGATVEELLKKLPGFQVNSRGEITAQGQRVSKVLVDGEEFFGNDPTVATQNIAAKAVDKVQIFDNKTEQQQITGMTSAQDGKTVNIKLKEDQKRGAFGKAEAGSNFNQYHDVKALYNRFVGKKKMSVYGGRSTTSTGSLSWQDRQKLGIENDYEYDEISGYYFSFGNSDEFDNWNLRGLPTAYNAGGLFINRWNADRQGVNGSYTFNQLGTTNRSSILTQNILPDTSFFTNQYSDNTVLLRQHALSFKYEWKLDSLRSLKLNVSGSQKTNISDNDTYSESLTEEKLFVNQSNRNNLTDALRLKWDNQLTYRQQFKKKDRLLLAVFRFGLIEDNNENYLRATNRFYTNGVESQVEQIDQQKLNNGNSRTLGGKITFSEPINSRLAIVGEYGFNNNNSVSRFNTYERGNNGKYETLNPLFSNNFDLDVNAHNGTLIGKYNHKKIRFAAGSGIATTRLNLYNQDKAERRVYNFLNFMPQLAFRFSPKQQSGISLNYRGTTRQPTINQLQPLRDNNDPLNIIIGNPDLKVGFNHSIEGFYNSYKVLKQRGVWMSFGANFQDNAITNKVTIDANGRRTTQPVNVNGNRNFHYWFDYNLGEGEKKWIVSLSSNMNGGRNNNFVNGLANRNTYVNPAVGFGLRYEISEKRSIYFRPNLGYNWSRTSLRPDQKINYFTYGGDVEGMLAFPGRIELRTNANFDLRQRLDVFAQNTNIIYWNATLSRWMDKKKKTRMLVHANDILNQNRGFERTINSNFITDQRYQRVSRYVMLKLEYTLNKMPGQ
ncbi:Carboxypeptidase regulatory-like domain-containing protein [Cnuella takakiae]|uniref:Carboxypeptidase regulatory-like domain-containing protein n=1 Tax=Cnuella takakiae TaxID=1302690 RepID=A0A1M4V5Q2_9BACT|nr:TonB-dependent receptor [Cnuella takakiae]SHE64275.1 Carboxypeptidase regulatory-like domain-containing protein [Cnuella takakiae]